MPLPAGTRFGPYEIQSPLGAGGMGEVYKARDTRLSRSVALKVLPSATAADPYVRSRLRREAEAIAALNHPNICRLYDIGEQSGVDYLVMEYIEGDTLAQRLRSGPLPIEQVLAIGIQIAEALDKAHRQGIVHRDLKPGNIMLTKQGAKLLDFGLAKLRGTIPAIRGLSIAVTQAPGEPPAQPLTGQGTILGTLHYMAPEQLEGRDADARTDLFAFGAVLYQMVTGGRAFDGDTPASVISAVMSTAPPPMAQKAPLTPPVLDHVVRRCLAKDPDERWQSAHDVLLELRWIVESSGHHAVTSVATGRTRAWKIGRTSAVVVAAAIAGALAMAARGERTSVSEQPVQFAIPTSGFGFRDAYAPVLSPDGSRAAFVALNDRGISQLFVRSLGSLAVTALDDTDGVLGAVWNVGRPFWSPDSRWIAFVVAGKLRKVLATGGGVQTLCDAPGLYWGGSWSRDDVIVFSAREDRGLDRVSANGGSVTPVTRPDRAQHEVGHFWPHFLPDGRHFLYLAKRDRPGTSTAYRASLDSTDRLPVIEVTSDVQYSAGSLLFVRDGALHAIAFDPASGTVNGQPQLLADGVDYFLSDGTAAISTSATGALSWREASTNIHRLIMVDRAGRLVREIASGGRFEVPRLAPDGERVAVQVSDRRTGTSDLWIYGTRRDASTRVTFDPEMDRTPVWSPDARRLAYAAVRGQLDPELYEIEVGAGGEQTLLRSPGTQLPRDWSADGRHLLFTTMSQAGNSDIWVLPMAGDRRAVPFAQTPANEVGPRISADGRWVVYTSNESGTNAIYVRPFQAPGVPWQVAARGLAPAWRGDGREIFFVDGRRIMAVSVVTTGGKFTAGEPRVLFEADLRASISYDVTRDGQRFILIVPSGAPSPNNVITLNWTRLLGK